MDQISPTRGSIEESVTGETANHLFYSTNRPLPILHSHILYQVASCLDDNVKTLRAMCSVSRNWREASRPFTFRLVNIKFLWQLEDFLQFLWSEPSIGGWVHTLNVELPGSSYGYSGSQYFELLVTLSKGFPALRTLALNGFDDTDFRSTPADFDFYTSAFPLLETLSLNAEELRFEDLVDFICRVPRIKHLTILGVSGGGTKPQQEPEQLPVTTGLNLPQLETIELLSSLASLKNLLLWLSSSSIIKTVKKLKTAMPFSPIAADLQVFGHFLKSIGPSLEELFLDMTPLPLGEDIEEGLSLWFNTGLRELTFYAQMDSFPNVIPLLQTLPPNSPHTRKINIYVYPDLIYKFLDPHQRISREFVEIDYLLAQNTKGNADEVVLQIVATQIDKALFARKEWCWSRYFLQEVFPLLDSQSRVKCVSSVLDRNDPVMNPRSRFCFDRQSEREMELSRQIEWMIATSCERLYGLS